MLFMTAMMFKNKALRIYISQRRAGRWKISFVSFATWCIFNDLVHFSNADYVCFVPIPIKTELRS